MTNITIPPEAVEKAAKAMYAAEPWSTFWSIEDARSLSRAAIRAAPAAWPRASGELSDNGNPHIILPLTENTDAET